MKNGNTRNKKWKHAMDLSRLDMDILITVATKCNTNKQLHESLRGKKGKKVAKSTISRHTTRLKEKGLLEQRIEFNVRPFEVTDKAIAAISIFMAKSQTGEWNLVRGHGFGFKCKILRAPRDLGEMLKAGGWVEFHPKNRTGYKKGLWGCSVVFNPSSVQFIPQEVYAASGEAAFGEAYRLVLKVQEFLREEYPGLVLGPVTVIYD